jgi:hypothetical protein
VKERTGEILVAFYCYHRPHRLRVAHEVVHKLKISPYFGGPLQKRVSLVEGMGKRRAYLSHDPEMMEPLPPTCKAQTLSEWPSRENRGSSRLCPISQMCMIES